jgi:hypothetical protein
VEEGSFFPGGTGDKVWKDRAGSPRTTVADWETRRGEQRSEEGTLRVDTTE